MLGHSRAWVDSLAWEDFEQHCVGEVDQFDGLSGYHFERRAGGKFWVDFEEYGWR